MKHPIDSQWYRTTFNLDLTDVPWTGNTELEVDYILKTINLTGGERILDLACGFGRHSLELARRGFKVVGVDISDELINHAKNQAKQNGLNVDFICADLRQLSFNDEFEVVLNMFDGAVGYLETEEENYKIFEVIALALKSGGKNIMHIPNPAYAQKYCPERTWIQGSSMIELLEYDWDEATHLMFATSCYVRYGELFRELKPVHLRQRLYQPEELQTIFASVGMKLVQIYSGDFKEETEPSDDCDYLFILSNKL